MSGFRRDPLAGAKHFSAVARSYDADAHEGFYRGIASALLDLIPGDVEPRNILDFGCGTGFSTLEVITRYPGAAITAFEPAAEMAALARERLSVHPTCTVTSEAPYGGPETAGEPGEARGADLVLVSMALHWAGPSSYSDIASSVSPGGWLAIAVPAPLVTGALGNRILVRSVRDALDSSEPRAFRPHLVPWSSRAWRTTDLLEVFPDFRPVAHEVRPVEDVTTAHELADVLHTRGAFTALLRDPVHIPAAKEAAARLAHSAGGSITTVWPVTLWVARRKEPG